MRSNNANPRTTVAGYAATELAILLAIMGILAAFAYPRYAALRAETKKALVHSLASNVQVSAQVAHLTWIVQDAPTEIIYNDRTIAMLYGYPDKASIGYTLASFPGFELIHAATTDFRKTDAASPDLCRVSYAEAAAHSSPSIDVLTSGC